MKRTRARASEIAALSLSELDFELNLVTRYL